MMEESEKKKQGNNKISEIKILSVQSLSDKDKDKDKDKDNFSYDTHPKKESSKEKIIDQAIKFHLEGNISQAEKYYQYSIIHGCNDPRVFSNYGSILKTSGNLKKAEISIRKAIELKPDYAIAHDNLGSLLRDLGQLKEAELSIRKAIEHKPDFANAHNNLGRILIELGNLKQAKISLIKAIKIKSEYFLAYLNLSICLYLLKEKKSALKAIENAKSIEPNNKDIILLSNIINSKLNIIKNKESELDKIRNNFFKEDKNLFITNKPIDQDLIKSLYKVKAIDANRINKYQPVIIGNTRGSDFNLFENNISNIKKLEEDLIAILETNIKSNIFIRDSFVTIFKSGGGVKNHAHINSFDRRLKCSNRKMSLVYYVSTGDQDCEDPGILKLYNPNKDILPSDGMIVIFPADRLHSASYSGKKDRIIVGVNFYII